MKTMLAGVLVASCLLSMSAVAAAQVKERKPPAAQKPKPVKVIEIEEEKVIGRVHLPTHEIFDVAIAGEPRSLIRIRDTMVDKMLHSADDL